MERERDADNKAERKERIRVRKGSHGREQAANLICVYRVEAILPPPTGLSLPSQPIVDSSPMESDSISYRSDSLLNRQRTDQR